VAFIYEFTNLRITNILIVAGEPSGDLHAAPVVRELQALQTDLTCFGAGGDLLKAERVELLATVEQMAVMGFSDVPRVLPRLARLKRDLLRRVERDRVPLAILVDYPGFNLNLARALKRLPHPPRILYYIAPQVWAWRAGRVKLIRRVVDRMAVVFPFEVKLFDDAGVPVSFVGHPLLDELSSCLPLPSRAVKIKGGDNPFLLALLPGSRKQEVERHLPMMLQSVSLLRRDFPDLRVGVGCAPNLERSLYERMAARTAVDFHPDSRRLLAESDAAAVCSGTATLEAALLDCPQVVVYRTSRLNYEIARRFVKIRNVALVNVVPGRQVASELLQDGFTPESLARELRRLLTNPSKREEIRQGYARVRELLGEPGAARKVAELAMRMIEP